MEGSSSTLDLLFNLRHDRCLGAVVALVAGEVDALIFTMHMTRGTATTTQAITSLTIGLLCGLAAGLLMGSRWG